MGFFYKHIIHPSLSRVVGRKAWTNNPYLGLVLDADEEDVIADELFRASLAYQDGLYSLPQDEKKAMDYCLKAANKGHAVAQLFMAQWLMKFHDDHNDNVMGWLMKAADQGERQSLYNLGISYHRGDIGGKTDIGKSHICFRASAEKLYGAACARMAVIFLFYNRLYDIGMCAPACGGFVSLNRCGRNVDGSKLIAMCKCTKLRIARNCGRRSGFHRNSLQIS